MLWPFRKTFLCQPPQCGKSTMLRTLKNALDNFIELPLLSSLHSAFLLFIAPITAFWDFIDLLPFFLWVAKVCINGGWKKFFCVLSLSQWRPDCRADTNYTRRSRLGPLYVSLSVSFDSVQILLRAAWSVWCWASSRMKIQKWKYWKRENCSWCGISIESNIHDENKLEGCFLLNRLFFQKIQNS